MKLVYVSTLCSINLINELLTNSKIKPLQSIQKYHRLLCEGFVSNGVKVETVSAIPITYKGSNKKIWNRKKETVDDITYNYVPFLNLKYLRQLFLFINTFFITIKKARKNDCVFICDVLNISISFSTLLACKLCKKKCLAIVTDLPDYANKKKVIDKILMWLFHYYDYYIFLTEQMNDKLNSRKKEYIVIEGIVDDEKVQKDTTIKNDTFIIMYAGGLYEEYGIKNLINAVREIKQKNLILELYGTGNLDSYIKNIDDSRIKYYGVVENHKIIKRETEVDLLINPRFSDQEYTLYSFPSKNIEFMASGTPLLTTKLAGIPKEYDKFCYHIENETVNGIKNELEKIIMKEKKELNAFGLNAQKFVLENKNKKIQSQKIINLISR